MQYNNGNRIRYLPKKLTKKRNCVVEKGKKIKTYFILQTAPFKAKYCSTEKFGTKWEESNQTLLKFITDHINKVMSSSVSEAKQRPNLQRHYLYLTSKNRLIKAYNCRLETELFNAQFILDIGNYVCKMFCNTKEKDFMIGDSTGKAKMCTLTLGKLIFKENWISKSFDLIIFFRKNDITDCRDYFNLVLDMEAIILWTMAKYNTNYVSAAAKLNLLC